MSIATLISQPCTIRSRTAGSVDAYGDITETETDTASFCELQPVKEVEVEGGSIGVSTWRLYLRGSVALNSDDAVIVDSEAYELVGDAMPRRNARTGMVEHTEAVVRRQRSVV